MDGWMDHGSHPSHLSNPIQICSEQSITVHNSSEQFRTVQKQFSHCGSCIPSIHPSILFSPVQPSWIVVDRQSSQFSHHGSLWIASSASPAIMDCCGLSVYPVLPVQPSQSSWIVVDYQFGQFSQSSQFSHLSHHHHHH